MAIKKTNRTAVNQKKVESKKTETKKTETKNIEVKEKVAEVEKKVEAFEAKTDKQVDDLVKKVWFVDKIIKASWVKEILNLSFMESANKWVRKNIELICKVLWILWLIGGVVMLISSFVFLFWGAFWGFLFFLICCAIVIIVSRGLMRMKEWFPAVAIICIAIDIVFLILSIFTSKIAFWTQLLSLLLWVICTLFVLKNKDMFKN